MTTKPDDSSKSENAEPEIPTEPRGRNLGEINQILQMMNEHDVSVLKLEDGPFRLCLKRGSQAPALSASTAPAVAPAPAQPGGPAAAPEADADADLVEVTSPMVGTFYRSSAPDSDPLVSVGHEVEEDTVVCIIEAMKVMNEVKAEVRGVIRRVLAENATPVQYGQPLFKVDPL